MSPLDRARWTRTYEPNGTHRTHGTISCYNRGERHPLHLRGLPGSGPGQEGRVPRTPPGDAVTSAR